MDNLRRKNHERYLEINKGVFKRDWSPAEKVLLILCCLLIGIVKGFLLSPVKKGISCGNNNGNVYNELDDDYWLDDED